MGFSRQEYWSGLPFPSPGDLPDAGIEPGSPALQEDALTSEPSATRQHIKKQRHYFANKGPSSQSYGFSSSHVWMWELNYKESWAPKNWCFQTLVMEKTLESPLECEGIQWVKSKANHWKYWCWSWNSNMLATWCEELTDWKRPWCWERLKVGREGDDRAWGGWMASLTQWTWLWANSEREWQEKPGVLQFMGLQRIGQDLATEQQQRKGKADILTD